MDRAGSRTDVKFSGTIANTSLPDVIQLLCIGRNTCRMAVRSGKNQGVIYFREGEIVHSQTGKLRGEEAFYAILSWELGVFHCEVVPAEKETIQESWDFLLMESMRRLEELNVPGR
jgi:hypothetical protein